MILFILKLTLLLTVLTYSNCSVSIRPIPQVYLGNTISIYCDLINEGTASWRRYPYTDQTNVTILAAPRLPARYNIENKFINSTYTISILTINGILVEDFSTYECSSFETSRANLTEAPPTTSTTTSTSTTLFTTTTISIVASDASNLCHNGSYNHVLFALLLISKISLAILLVSFMKFLKPTIAADILVTFGCVIASIGFGILMVIFWISPAYVSSYPSNQYWSPIVIVPSSIIGFIVLWSGILYFIIKSFIEDTFIKIFEIIGISVIAFCQFILLAVILSSVVYCTGKSVFPALSTDYSIVSNICAGLIVTLCFIFVIYFFWIFREQMASIEVTPDQKKKRKIPNVLKSSSKSSKFNENIITIVQPSEYQKPTLMINNEVYSSYHTDKNSKIDLKDGLNLSHSNSNAFKSFLSENRSNEFLTASRIETDSFNGQVRKSRENVLDDFLVPPIEPVSSRVNYEVPEESKASIVNIIRRNSIVNVLKAPENKELKEVSLDSLKSSAKDETIQNDTIEEIKVKKKKKKVKKSETDEKTPDSEEKEAKKKKKIKKKSQEDSTTKDETDQQEEKKNKKVKKVKNQGTQSQETGGTETV